MTVERRPSDPQSSPGGAAPGSGPATSEAVPSSAASEGPAASAFPVVGIGASAGGLEAFSALLEQLPGDAGMAFVLIQHMAPDSASMLPASSPARRRCRSQA